MPFRTLMYGGLFALSCIAICSCGSGSETTFGAGNGSNGQGADGGGYLGLGTGDSGIMIPSDGGLGSGSIPGSLEDDVACAGDSRKGQQTPIDLYIVMDRSPSMTELISDNKTTKWQAVVNALNGFLSDPASSGIGVGVQFFPLVRTDVPAACTSNAQCGTSGPCDALIKACDNAPTVTLCNSADDCPKGGRCVELGVCGNAACTFVGNTCAATPTQRATPCTSVGHACQNRDLCDLPSYQQAAVDIAPLPGSAAAISAALTQHAPDDLAASGTPTVMAMNGAVAHAAPYAASHTGRRTVLVLVTDGLPTLECEPPDPMPVSDAMLIQRVTAAATTASAANPSVSTFVIGVFAPDEATAAQPNLDAIAASGGTNQAFIVRTSQNVTADFIAALDSIRTTALPCEYAVPQGDGGQVDFEHINVKFTSGAGKVTRIGYSGGNAQSCAKTGGWFYDVDPAKGSPTKIEMCPATCTSLKADLRGQVDIELGCQRNDIIR